MPENMADGGGTGYVQIKAKPKSKPKPKAAPAAKAVKSPSGISSADWNLVSQIAHQSGIDPMVLVAIGMHETGWGSQGAGQAGYTLGVGVYSSSNRNTQYQGLANQLQGAAGILARYGVHTIADIAAGKLAPVGGHIRYAADPNWSAGVVSAYNGLTGGRVRVPSTSQATTAFAADSGSGAAVPKTMTVGQYLDDPNVASQYGYLAAYMKDPELGPILAKAAQGGWGANQLQGALSKTHWWKTMSASAREWQATWRLDPATARQQVNAKGAELRSLAASMGFGLHGDRLWAMANHAMAGAWTQLQEQEAVAAEWHYQPGHVYGGTAGNTITKLTQMAADQLVPISPTTMGSWTEQVLQGTATPESFAGYLKQQATSLYPYMKDALDSGMTADHWADPYRQVAAQTLDRNPNEIDFTKPLWQAALTQVDPKSGQRVPMTLDAWQTRLKQNTAYGYDTTNGAMTDAAQFATQIAKQFGAMGA